MLEQDLKISCERAQINGASIMTRIFLEGNLLTFSDEVEDRALMHLRECGNELCRKGGNILGNYRRSDWKSDQRMKRLVDEKLIDWMSHIHESISSRY